MGYEHGAGWADHLAEFEARARASARHRQQAELGLSIGPGGRARIRVRSASERELAELLLGQIGEAEELGLSAAVWDDLAAEERLAAEDAEEALRVAEESRIRIPQEQ